MTQLTILLKKTTTLLKTRTGFKQNENNFKTKTTAHTQRPHRLIWKNLKARQDLSCGSDFSSLRRGSLRLKLNPVIYKSFSKLKSAVRKIRGCIFSPQTLTTIAIFFLINYSNTETIFCAQPSWFTGADAFVDLYKPSPEYANTQKEWGAYWKQWSINSACHTLYHVIESNAWLHDMINYRIYGKNTWNTEQQGLATRIESARDFYLEVSYFRDFNQYEDPDRPNKRYILDYIARSSFRFINKVDLDLEYQKHQSWCRALEPLIHFYEWLTNRAARRAERSAQQLKDAQDGYGKALDSSEGVKKRCDDVLKERKALSVGAGVVTHAFFSLLCCVFPQLKKSWVLVSALIWLVVSVFVIFFVRSTRPEIPHSLLNPPHTVKGYQIATARLDGFTEARRKSASDFKVIQRTIFIYTFAVIRLLSLTVLLIILRKVYFVCRCIWDWASVAILNAVWSFLEVFAIRTKRTLEAFVIEKNCLRKRMLSFLETRSSNFWKFFIVICLYICFWTLTLSSFFLLTVPVLVVSPKMHGTAKGKKFVIAQAAALLLSASDKKKFISLSGTLEEKGPSLLKKFTEFITNKQQLEGLKKLLNETSEIIAKAEAAAAKKTGPSTAKDLADQKTLSELKEQQATTENFYNSRQSDFIIQEANFYTEFSLFVKEAKASEEVIQGPLTVEQTAELIAAIDKALTSGVLEGLPFSLSPFIVYVGGSVVSLIAFKTLPPLTVTALLSTRWYSGWVVTLPLTILVVTIVSLTNYKHPKDFQFPTDEEEPNPARFKDSTELPEIQTGVAPKIAEKNLGITPKEEVIIVKNTLESSGDRINPTFLEFIFYLSCLCGALGLIWCLYYFLAKVIKKRLKASSVPCAAVQTEQLYIKQADLWFYCKVVAVIFCPFLAHSPEYQLTMTVIAFGVGIVAYKYRERAPLSKVVEPVPAPRPTRFLENPIESPEYWAFYTVFEFIFYLSCLCGALGLIWCLYYLLAKVIKKRLKASSVPCAAVQTEQPYIKQGYGWLGAIQILVLKNCPYAEYIFPATVFVLGALLFVSRERAFSSKVVEPVPAPKPTITLWNPTESTEDWAPYIFFEFTFYLTYLFGALGLIWCLYYLLAKVIKKRLKASSVPCAVVQTEQLYIKQADLWVYCKIVVVLFCPFLAYSPEYQLASTLIVFGGGILWYKYNNGFPSKVVEPVPAPKQTRFLENPIEGPEDATLWTPFEFIFYLTCLFGALGLIWCLYYLVAKTIKKRLKAFSVPCPAVQTEQPYIKQADLWLYCIALAVLYLFFALLPVEYQIALVVIRFDIWIVKRWSKIKTYFFDVSTPWQRNTTSLSVYLSKASNKRSTVILRAAYPVIAVSDENGIAYGAGARTCRDVFKAALEQSDIIAIVTLASYGYARLCYGWALGSKTFVRTGCTLVGSALALGFNREPRLRRLHAEGEILQKARHAKDLAIKELKAAEDKKAAVSSETPEVPNIGTSLFDGSFDLLTLCSLFSLLLLVIIIGRVVHKNWSKIKACFFDASTPWQRNFPPMLFLLIIGRAVHKNWRAIRAYFFDVLTPWQRNTTSFSAYLSKATNKRSTFVLSSAYPIVPICDDLGNPYSQLARECRHGFVLVYKISGAPSAIALAGGGIWCICRGWLSSNPYQIIVGGSALFGAVFVGLFSNDQVLRKLYTACAERRDLQHAIDLEAREKAKGFDWNFDFLGYYFAFDWKIFALLLFVIIVKKAISKSKLKSKAYFFDASTPWQRNFQTPATAIREKIVDLHHDVRFFLILVVIFVSWRLYRIVHFYDVSNLSRLRVKAGLTIYPLPESFVFEIKEYDNFGNKFSAEARKHREPIIAALAKIAAETPHPALGICGLVVCVGCFYMTVRYKRPENFGCGCLLIANGIYSYFRPCQKELIELYWDCVRKRNAQHQFDLVPLWKAKQAALKKAAAEAAGLEVPPVSSEAPIVAKNSLEEFDWNLDFSSYCFISYGEILALILGVRIISYAYSKGYFSSKVVKPVPALKQTRILQKPTESPEDCTLCTSFKFIFYFTCLREALGLIWCLYYLLGKAIKKRIKNGWLFRGTKNRKKEVTKESLLEERRLFSVNFGPQHPSAHGVLRLVLDREGETIIKAEPHIGLLHRSSEKLIESKTLNQALPYVDRLDYVSRRVQEQGFALTAEGLLDFEVPDRAQYIRTIFAELTRLLNHVRALTTHARDVGALTPFLWAFEEREKIREFYERVSGTRRHTAFIRPGGISNDIPIGTLHDVYTFAKQFNDRVNEREELLTENRIWRYRLRGVGNVNLEETGAWTLSGVRRRGSGRETDLRRDNGYEAYENTPFVPPVTKLGDCFDRYFVRIEERRQSLNLLQQLVNLVAGGPIKANALNFNPSSRLQAKQSREGTIEHFHLSTGGFTVAAREAFASVEAPKGEFGRSSKTNMSSRAYRNKFKAPGFTHLQGLNFRTVGHRIADVVAAIGSQDIVFGEVDR